MFRLFLSGIGFCCIALPIALATSTEPYEQQFMITAYYSPLPGQCCYVRGGYESDKILNGQGIAATDGTGVYPGMAAAPPAYDFGARIHLPSIGTVEVHDRGGAIIELGDGVHRLDLWMGHGEEGLARALHFGVWWVTGTVYPAQGEKPEVQLELQDFAAPPESLRPFLVQHLLATRLKKEDRSLSVRLMQRYLQAVGYFRRSSTGYFGNETEAALRNFLNDYNLSDQPADQLTRRSAAQLTAAYQRRDTLPPIDAYVDGGSSPVVIAQAQRTLRYLGYYSGRTDQQFSDTLRRSIVRFQLQKGIITSEEDWGAGRIGPSTLKSITAAWNAKRATERAQKLMNVHRIEQYMEENGYRLASFLEEGYQGAQVRILQRLLGEYGFFHESINGVFGPATKQAVIDYQIDRGLIKTAEDFFAGTVGPLTLEHLRDEKRDELHAHVRARGWQEL